MSRYLGDENRFQRQVSLSLRIDPTYLEAMIAKKEGKNYLDPFCYLSVDDLCVKPNILRPTSSILLPVNYARIDQVRDGINIKPIFIIKSERSKFRKIPSIEMDMALGVEVCAVLPGSPGIPDDWKWPVGDSRQFRRAIEPFLDVLAGKREFTTILAACMILADDPDDPFFKVFYLNMFPIAIGAYPFDYQPFLGRYEGLRLCRSPHKTIFVFLDEHNDLILINNVDLSPIGGTLLNAGEIIRLLPDTPITMAEWKTAVEVHDQHSFYRIAGKNGRIYTIPKYRTGKERANVIFDLAVRGGQIRAKHEQDTSKARELKYDVFVSHSHHDQEVAYALTEWMQELWPGIKIFMTSRDQRELDELIPGRYFLALQASRCVLFLATAGSLGSGYALMELGSAMQLGIRVVAVCANGSTIYELEANGLLGDFDLVTDLTEEDAEKALLDFLESTLSITIPEDYEVGRLNQLLRKPRYIPDNEAGEQVDMSKIPDAHKIAAKQQLSEEDALKWLGILEKHVENKARMAGLRPEMLPKETDAYGRLIMIMMVSDDEKYDELLQPFAALIDNQFCLEVEYMWDFARRQGDPLADKYLKLIRAAQKIIDNRSQFK